MVKKLLQAFVIIITIIISLEFSSSTNDSNRNVSINQNSTNPKNYNHKLKAFIHIGSTKTGSTHIQGYLKSKRKSLLDVHYNIPTFQGGWGISYQRLLLDELNDYPKTSKNLQTFIRDNYNSNKSIIISAEALMGVNDIQINNLVNFLKGYNVTVIMYYRDLLVRCLSAYYKHMSRLDYILPEFSDYADQHLDTSRAQTINAIEKFGSAFGFSSLIIVEYEGVLHSGKDIAYIFTCEVIGILCAESAALNHKRAHHLNSKPEQLPRQLLNLIEEYTLSSPSPCKYFNTAERQRYLRKIETEVRNIRNREVPRLVVSLNKYMNITIDTDTAIRNNYQYKCWLYPDSYSVNQSRSKLQYYRLDTYRLFSDESYWKTWFNNLISKLEISETCSDKEH